MEQIAYTTGDLDPLGKAVEADIAAAMEINGAGIDRRKLTYSTGRPKGTRNLHAKHPSSLAKRLMRHGVDWVAYLADSLKTMTNNNLTHRARLLAREDVKMWLKALPYMVTTTNTVKVKKWKGKASKAAKAALDALEGR